VPTTVPSVLLVDVRWKTLRHHEAALFRPPHWLAGRRGEPLVA
jgi:hypothetical protein